ncbi:hypothetical protein B0A58_02775 [Flavobacterium branchiophilum NBRC 15030 = ATCC 35035]|uniref:LysM domain-containing protein n=1 Tax=Flavobacterium branchiophilum TaxID=55197 RepID=A0A543G261_9FLAO|nr:hypothetical protein [Flavobacterium branchiophilum]OXA80103.1 hypothetical protein B0A58_02775 [Flavobacterium branchiophilum NBRC 15030 = ATCC 35035]TQM40161.1 hypothetical protein BC670_1031 [Flavobacterium branchiophilum]GEM54938.1 hypothetical protein FB1_11590 [Flavobacterium branchiophilum NBRC 15030 = ATCC 35035]
MMEKIEFVKYFLNEGDTVESVAQKFDISINWLISVHNINVEIKDKIQSQYDGFPKHLTSIYLTEDVVKNIEKKNERKTGYVIWADKFYKSKTYGFQVVNYKKETLLNKIHYILEMVYKKNEDKQIVLEINRKQVYINNKHPDTIIEQLANRISETIFPLQLQVSGNGEIESLANHKEIVERWKTKKDELTAYYKGEIAEKIMAKATNFFKNKYILTESLIENWFFNLFFKPIYGSYSTKKVINYNSTFPFESKEYEMTQNLEDVYSKTNKVIVNTKGKSINSNTKKEAIIQYKLNDMDKSIFSIVGTFTSNDKRTQVEIYQQ